MLNLAPPISHKFRESVTRPQCLSADANLWYAQEFDPSTSLSLKNGGGIRDAIGAIATDGVPVPPLANPLVGKGWPSLVLEHNPGGPTPSYDYVARFNLDVVNPNDQ